MFITIICFLQNGVFSLDFILFYLCAYSDLYFDFRYYRNLIRLLHTGSRLPLDCCVGRIISRNYGKFNLKLFCRKNCYSLKNKVLNK